MNKHQHQTMALSFSLAKLSTVRMNLLKFNVLLFKSKIVISLRRVTQRNSGRSHKVNEPGTQNRLQLLEWGPGSRPIKLLF